MQQGIIEKNHMDILWHDYALNKEDTLPITEASLIEKASIVGRTGMMLLSCGTGAWRVRSSMNTLSRELGITCTADIGLMSIEYTCFDGENCFSQSLCLTNTGVNTSKLNRLENFINDFPTKEKYLSGEQLHSIWMKSNGSTVCIPRSHSDLPLHLPVAHLPFFWVAVRWKCFSPSAVPESVTL